ncbi:hypothetical protein ACHAW5_000170 [Stephanodiscus triporus]|uniref:Uncharacterized protein n=1 Tax=Stephanodiscus triporus TaxID=2934178 RepID=A0ABD3P4W2_9STRA
MKKAISPECSSQMSTCGENRVRSRMSRSAVGALFLLSTPCASFQGGNPIAPPPPPSAIRRRGDARSRGFELRYRDGDDNQPVDMKAGSSGGALCTTQTLGSGLTPAAEVDTRQVDMDEYIEYLERRYSRIHRVTTASFDRPRVAVVDSRIIRSMFTLSILDRRASTAPAASASSSSSSSSRFATCQGEECDHLNILGLSGLASAELRRRLNGTKSSRRPRSLGLLGRARSTMTDLNGGARALGSSLRIVTNFCIMTVIPDLLEGGFGLSVTSFAILLLVRPLLRWGHFGQGQLV